MDTGRLRVVVGAIWKVLGTAVLGCVLLLVLLLRNSADSSFVPQLDGGASVANRLDTAAKAIEAATSGSGGGVTFDAVQYTTEYTKAGGSPIPVVDPADPRLVTGSTDQLFINGMLTRGVWTSAGYWMEMRLAPPPGDPINFDSAPRIFGVIKKNAAIWRDDGAGWYVTDQSPGMGIDPVSASKLPGALRKLGSIASLGTKVVDGQSYVGFRGSAAVADYPGVIASDGASFTEGTFTFEAWLNPTGQLGQIVLRARNTGEVDYDLVSETTITFSYAGGASVPEPAPTMAPEPPPPPDPAASPVTLPASPAPQN